MVSFLSAVKERYGATDDPNSYADDAFLVGNASRKRNKKWEMVGMEDMRQKQSQFEKIFMVSVRECNIDVAEGEAGEIVESKITNVRELDLTGNPELTMEGIATIVKVMPKLQLLQLSNIPLAASLTMPSEWNLTKLVLNFTGISSLDQLAEIKLTNLRELHLDGNKLTTFASEKRLVFEKVETLNVASNAIASWDASAIQAAVDNIFPALTHIGLSGNPLPDLVGVDGAALKWMEKLNSLWISDLENMKSVKSIDVVRERCPNISSLRVTYAHILPKLGEMQARALVIASMPTLTSLNNGSVRPKERTDAELFYLQRGLAVSDEEREESYSLVPVLREKYKDVVLSGDVGNASAAHVMLDLRFRMIGKEEVRKSVPSSMQVDKLKVLIQTFFNLEVAKQELAFSAADLGGLTAPTPLDNDLQSLAFFGVGVDAVISVVDTTARK